MSRQRQAEDPDSLGTLSQLEKFGHRKDDERHPERDGQLHGRLHRLPDDRVLDGGVIAKEPTTNLNR